MSNLLSPRFDVYNLKDRKSLNFYSNFKEMLLKKYIIDNNLIPID